MTVLNKLVVVTVPLAVGPVIVSVRLAPVTLVPVIVNVLDERLLELEIVMCELSELPAIPL